MKFIAHRGYSHRFPENSLEAFEAVLRHPLHRKTIIGIELDVHLTADDRIPVMHEVNVRADNGSMIAVADCSFQKLQKLHLQQYNSERPSVPDINAVLALINHQTDICFEIKMGTYNLERFTKIFSEILATYRPAGDVTISSFSTEILEFVRPYLAALDVQYGFIFKEPTALSTLTKKLRDSFDYLHPWYKLLYTNSGLFSDSTPIRCWTVNDSETVASLIKLSSTLPIDAVMTDNIELAAIPAGT